MIPGAIPLAHSTSLEAKPFFKKSILVELKLVFQIIFSRTNLFFFFALKMKWLNGKKSIFKYQELASKLILPF